MQRHISCGFFIAMFLIFGCATDSRNKLLSPENGTITSHFTQELNGVVYGVKKVKYSEEYEKSFQKISKEKINEEVDRIIEEYTVFIPEIQQYSISDQKEALRIMDYHMCGIYEYKKESSMIDVGYVFDPYRRLEGPSYPILLLYRSIELGNITQAKELVGLFKQFGNIIQEPMTPVCKDRTNVAFEIFFKKLLEQGRIEHADLFREHFSFLLDEPRDQLLYSLYDFWVYPDLISYAKEVIQKLEPSQPDLARKIESAFHLTDQKSVDSSK